MYVRDQVAARLCAAGLLLAAAHRAAAAWHVPQADVRFRLEAPRDAARGADTGYCRVWTELAPQSLRLRVTTADGTAVGHEVLWSAEGEAAKVLFDASSGGAVYFAYAGSGVTGAPPAWTRRSGVVVETRPRTGGEPTSAAQIRTLCTTPTVAPLGASLVPSIFLGVHPHGPTRDFAAFFCGFFQAERDGLYEFATVSDDASCLYVDGTLVAEWPGWHDVHGGRHGQHGGSIRLRAGRHRIECCNVENGEGFMVSAAWKPPGAERFETMPARAFPPVLHFRASAADLRPGLPYRPLPAWDTSEHSIVDEFALITCDLAVLNEASGRTYRWEFDDGVAQQGPRVSHVFSVPGVRHATVRSVGEGGSAGASTAFHVRVGPAWAQGNEWSQDAFKRQLDWILPTDFSHTPAGDLAAFAGIADRLSSVSMLRKFGDLAVLREAQFGPEHAELFVRLALDLQNARLRSYERAAQAFRIAIRLAGDGDVARRELARLHLAGLLIHVFERFDEGEALLRGLQADALVDTGVRLKTIFEADALLGGGDVAAARKLYASVGTVVDLGDRDYAVRRRARLETALDFLRREEYDDAERIIREVEWETPLERLNPETGLVLTRVHLGRQEYGMARAHARRLLRACETDERRADVLFYLGAACQGLGDAEGVAAVRKELQEKHPYSEATAKARERWGK